MYLRFKLNRRMKGNLMQLKLITEWMNVHGSEIREYRRLQVGRLMRLIRGKI